MQGVHKLHFFPIMFLKQKFIVLWQQRTWCKLPPFFRRCLQLHKRTHGPADLKMESHHKTPLIRALIIRPRGTAKYPKFFWPEQILRLSQDRNPKANRGVEGTEKYKRPIPESTHAPLMTKEEVSDYQAASHSHRQQQQTASVSTAVLYDSSSRCKLKDTSLFRVEMIRKDTVCVCAETVNLRLEYADVRGRNIMLDIILRYSCTHFCTLVFLYLRSNRGYKWMVLW